MTPTPAAWHPTPVGRMGTANSWRRSALAPGRGQAASRHEALAVDRRRNWSSGPSWVRDLRRYGDERALPFFWGCLSMRTRVISRRVGMSKITAEKRDIFVCSIERFSVPKGGLQQSIGGRAYHLGGHRRAGRIWRKTEKNLFNME